MGSHHFIGTGPLSEELRAQATSPDGLIERVRGMVADCGLRVVGEQSARFDNEGLTLVWILAESHLVLHYWGAEGFATVDLHVCDYQGSNRQKAARLVAALTALCFAPGSESWREVHLDDPVRKLDVAPAV